MQKIHIVGIKGVGVVGLATLYKEWGNIVSGSDTAEEFFTDKILKNLKIPVFKFNKSNLSKDIDLVIHSTAYSKDHPEIAEAVKLGIKVQSYTEALAGIFNSKKGVMVTGTHGKTTTTAMLGRICEDAGLDPTVLVGGEVVDWGRTARAGKSDLMIVEGDEYQAKILEMKPRAILITNIEYDHPDLYKTKDAYEDVFKRVKSLLPENGIFIEGPFDSSVFEGLELQIIGEHNRVNAAGALVLARALGVTDDVSMRTLREFKGVRRRLELYSEQDADIVVIDDYAHHPTEIQAALRAIRARYQKRNIVAIFQPHTYSRTEAFLNEFAHSFSDADEVIVLAVYGSARETTSSLKKDALYTATQQVHTNVNFSDTIEDAINACRNRLRKNSVFITIGAGDVWQVAHSLLTIIQP